jgi:hypothetical protein
VDGCVQKRLRDHEGCTGCHGLYTQKAAWETKPAPPNQKGPARHATTAVPLPSLRRSMVLPHIKGILRGKQMHSRARLARPQKQKLTLYSLAVALCLEGLHAYGHVFGRKELLRIPPFCFVPSTAKSAVPLSSIPLADCSCRLHMRPPGSRDNPFMLAALGGWPRCWHVTSLLMSATPSRSHLPCLRIGPSTPNL